MDKRTHRIPVVIAWLGIAAGVAVFLLPAPDGLSPGMLRTAGVVIVAISLWATAALPEYFTALIFFLLAVALADASPATVFSGFHSAAGWVVFGGLVLGAAVQETGFGKVLAGHLLRVFPKSYAGLLVGATITGMALCFILPSNTGRVVIMLPVFLAMADRVGLRPGRPGRTGLAFAATAGSIYPSFGVLPAAVPNLGWLGAAESVHGIEITYGQYLLANFPVIGAVSVIAIPLVVSRLFPDRIDAADPGTEPAELSPELVRLALILAATLGLWMTDFAHGVSPAWIVLGAAILCMLPGAGVIPPSALVGRVSYAPWFFVCGVIGMGAVVSEAGMGSHLSDAMFLAAPLADGADFANFAAVAAASAAMALVTTLPGQPAIMTTLLPDIAAATGWPLLTVLMTQPLSWAMAPFAYQFPPWILAAHIAGASAGKLAQLLLAMAAVAWFVLLPLQFLWLGLLGFFG